MRLNKYILCLLLMMPLAMTAQNIKNLTKQYVGKIEVVDRNGIQNFYVKHGEFKLDFDHKVTDAYNYLYTKNYKYFVIVRDSRDNVLCAKMNNYELAFKNMNEVKILKAGYVAPDYVYLEKRNITYKGESQFKYYLHVSGRLLGPYDEVLDMFPDGFVYRLGNKYSYSTYDIDYVSYINFPIPSESLYSEKNIRCYLKDTVLEFKPYDNVRYYTTDDGHYYLLYNDKYMDNTLMVVDSIGYELDGVMENVALKYSQDGNHWIAAYTNNVLVDGVNVMQLSEKIKHIAIKNNGDYAFVVEGKDKNDKLYFGEVLVLQGADVKWLAIDIDERFNYICRNKKGYFYGVDHEFAAKNEDMKNYFYPSLFDSDEKFVVMSKDGRHIMEYSYDTPYIMIDNTRIDSQSIPHYAKWKESDKSFIWNAVEGVNLYVYEYKVKD